MERRLPLIFAAIFQIFSITSITAQSARQNDKIQFLLWAEREAYPGVNWDKGVIPDSEVNADDTDPFSLPVSRLKKTAPFFVQGMLYGWQLVYTPYDKARGVAEYIEFNPVQELTEGELKKIRYVNPAFKDDRLYCRVEFDRSEFNQNLFLSWQSVTNPRVRGLGYGALEKGFEGIQEACAEAMKNAVREYWRDRIKNKPREISGRLILCKPPVIGVEAGRYRVTLDFFMETDRILEYKMF